MITIAGRQLISSTLVNSSPQEHPWRTFIFGSLAIIFIFYALQIFRNLDRGVTLALPKTGFPFLKIYPGKIKANPRLKLQHYDNPYLTGLLGLILFTAAEFLIVIIFKSTVYTFR